MAFLGQRGDVGDCTHDGFGESGVFDIEDVVLAGALVGVAGLSVAHLCCNAIELLDVGGIVADDDDRAIIDVEHVFAEHFSVAKLTDSGKLFAKVFYKILSCSHILYIVALKIGNW